MRGLGCLLLLVVLVTSCDPARVYETNYDFEQRYWLITEIPAFKFETPASGRYSIYFNVRNESSFREANVYYKYNLMDSTGRTLDSELRTDFLFHPKSGKPYGSSTLGDIYDHQFLLKEAIALEKGEYTINFEQFSRADTLRGILSVGVRVERAD